MSTHPLGSASELVSSSRSKRVVARGWGLDLAIEAPHSQGEGAWVDVILREQVVGRVRAAGASLSPRSVDDRLRALLQEAAASVAEHLDGIGDVEGTALEAVEQRDGYGSILGASEPMQALYEVLDKLIASESTVLIQGENGTGKELVARAIHQGSSRRSLPFVIQNCSAFNENLLDSELFGHKRGSFTGAISDKPGLLKSLTPAPSSSMRSATCRPRSR